jgi:hypothetical protein
MHIPARGTTTPDPTATGDCDVLDHGGFIFFCDSFRYLGTQITPDLEEPLKLTLELEFVARSFVLMKDIFSKKIDFGLASNFICRYH